MHKFGCVHFEEKLGSVLTKILIRARSPIFQLKKVAERSNTLHHPKILSLVCGWTATARDCERTFIVERCWSHVLVRTTSGENRTSQTVPSESRHQHQLHQKKMSKCDSNSSLLSFLPAQNRLVPECSFTRKKDLLAGNAKFNELRLLLRANVKEMPCRGLTRFCWNNRQRCRISFVLLFFTLCGEHF